MRTLAIILLLANAGCSSSSNPEGETRALVAVKTAVATRGNVELKVTAPATVYPREQANIAARITSPIRELRARKGDRVRQGQILAMLEDRDLRAQRAEAEASIADAQASLEKISSGTLPTDIDRAQGQVATARAAFDLAQKNYDRRRELFEQGAIPLRDLNVSETELAQSKTALEVARKALDLLQNQSGQQDIRIAQSRLEQARARLAGIEAQLAYTELRSPFDGLVTEQMAYPGDMAKPDSPIFTVMNLSTLVARAQVPEAETAKAREGQACRFEPSDPPGMTASGHVTVVNRTVDPARRTVEVWCEIPSPPAWLRVGSFGMTDIITGEVREGVLVPRVAVQFEEGTRGGIVMVLDAQRLAHEQIVECGPEMGDLVQIVSGLTVGETVITEGGFGLPEGTQVSVAGEPARGQSKK